MTDAQESRLLLLEHLREITGGKMQSDIDEAKKAILEHALKRVRVPPLLDGWRKIAITLI